LVLSLVTVRLLAHRSVPVKIATPPNNWSRIGLARSMLHAGNTDSLDTRAPRMRLSLLRLIAEPIWWKVNPSRRKKAPARSIGLILSSYHILGLGRCFPCIISTTCLGSTTKKGSDFGPPKPESKHRRTRPSGSHTSATASRSRFQ